MTQHPSGIAIKVFDGVDGMSEFARQHIVALAEQGIISLALSGGSTPKKLYEQLHAKNLDLLRDKKAIKFIMGDDRLYAADNEQSNIHMATKALLRDVPSDCIFPVDSAAALPTSEDPVGGVEGAKIVAKGYEALLLEHLPVEKHVVNGKEVSIPIIDVVLLGFGSDGHTASIFPSSIASADTEHAVSVSFPSPTMNPKVWRVTLTPHVIQHAKHVIVLAAGGDKNWVIKGILDATVTEGEVPVARFLRECKGQVTFLLDKDSGANVL